MFVSRPSQITSLLLLCMALVTSGCNGMINRTVRGNGYSEDVNALTENLRPPADEKVMTGLDQRARDIEQNLGVR